MKFEKESSGVAKAGLATGITGTALGTIGLLGAGASALGSIVGGRRNGCDCISLCNEDHPVDRYTLDLKAQIAEKDTQIALRDANNFTDRKLADISERNEKRFRSIEEQLCKQAVENQKTADSFQIVNERLQCCCDNFGEKINNERKERECADNAIVNYSNATFYPRQVADVRTSNETTPQVLFNPLPSCGSCSRKC